MFLHSPCLLVANAREVAERKETLRLGQHLFQTMITQRSCNTDEGRAFVRQSSCSGRSACLCTCACRLACRRPLLFCELSLLVSLTPLHSEQCRMHVSDGCGVKHLVQLRLRGAPPAVLTVQLQYLTSHPSSSAVQKILDGIDMVCFSLHAVCSNTQSGPLQCPGLSAGCDSLMLLVLTPVHAVGTTQTKPSASCPSYKG